MTTENDDGGAAENMVDSQREGGAVVAGWVHGGRVVAGRVLGGRVVAAATVKMAAGMNWTKTVEHRKIRSSRSVWRSGNAVVAGRVLGGRVVVVTTAEKERRWWQIGAASVRIGAAIRGGATAEGWRR